MKNRWLLLSFGAALALGRLWASDSVPAAFGFVNETGRRILVLDPIETPPAIDRAVCTDGVPFGVAFNGERNAALSNSRYATARDFFARNGYEYRVLGPTAHADDTCFLVADRYLRGRTVLKTAPSRRAPPSGLLHAIELDKGRRVTGLSRLATIGSTGTLYLAVYENRFPNGPTALVFTTGKGRAYWDRMDHPLEGVAFQSDDDQITDPSRYRVPFAWKDKDGISFALVNDTGRGIRSALVRYDGKTLYPLFERYRHTGGETASAVPVQ